MKHINHNYAKRSKRLLLPLFLLLSGLVLAACNPANNADNSAASSGSSPGTESPAATTPASSPTEEVITITIDNVGATAWLVTTVEGAQGIAELNTQNTAITLEPGQRYRFINNGGGFHPLDFRDASGNFLLTQNSVQGSFENDTEVNFESDATGVTFTLTPALAEQMATYWCSVHPPMTGAINIASGN